MKPVYEIRDKDGNWVAAFAEMEQAQAFVEVQTGLEMWRVDFPPFAGDVETLRAQLWAAGVTVAI